MAKPNTSCRRQWNKKDIESAIKEVRKKEMGFLKAGIFHIIHTFFEMVKFKICTLSWFMNILKLVIRIVQ